MKAIVYVLPLLTVACAHLGKTSVKNPTAQPTQPVAIAEATPSDRPATLPATYEEYYVGTMVDPDDPTFTYQPGQLLVQTRPERLRLGPPDGLQPGIDYGPDTAARMANDHPEPTATEPIAAAATRPPPTRGPTPCLAPFCLSSLSCCCSAPFPVGRIAVAGAMAPAVCSASCLSSFWSWC